LYSPNCHFGVIPERRACGEGASEAADGRHGRITFDTTYFVVDRREQVMSILIATDED
jgi:hypothetical protein